VSSETVESVAQGADSYATNQTFEGLGVSRELVAVLTAQGITTAFPIQAMTIADALAGRDVCGKAKTGSGKTLGFGLPMLQRLAAGTTLGAANSRPARPRGLVLLPTRELAVQVYEVLKPLGAALGLHVAAV
jgi:superfamily II DNA/RNA helicase